MYVVKRPFKSLGKYYAVGTVIADPTAIKRFNGKLAEGKIVNVTEQTYDSAAKYFKEKFFVDLPPLSLDTDDKKGLIEGHSDDTQNDDNNVETKEVPTATVAKASVVSAK